MKNFRLIAVRILPGCDASFVKCLKENTFYYLNNDYAISCDGHEIKPRSSSITPLDDDFFTLEEDDKDSKINVNLSAVVGKNGDGKSSLIEIVIRLLNNFYERYDLDPLRSLHHIKGLCVELYYLLDGTFFRLKEDSNKLDNDIITLDQYIGNNNAWTLHTTSIPREKMPGSLFYTLVSNYSHYAYNTEDIDNPWHDIRSEDHWLHHVFHKNDGYQTPLSIHPFRSKGNIDMNREKHLSRQRVLATWLRSSINEDRSGNSMVFNGKKAVELRLTDIGCSKLQEVTFRQFFQHSSGTFLLGDAIETVTRFINITKTFDQDETTGTLFIGIQMALIKCARKYFGHQNNLRLFNDARDWIVKEGLTDNRSDLAELLDLMDRVPEEDMAPDVREAIAVWRQFSMLSLMQIQRIEMVDYICDLWEHDGLPVIDERRLRFKFSPELIFKPYSKLNETEKCLHYILYKTISIFETYPTYGFPCRKYSDSALFFDDMLPGFTRVTVDNIDSGITRPFLQLAEDWNNKTHTTLKLRQTYNYFRETGPSTWKIYHRDHAANPESGYTSIEFTKLSNAEKAMISDIANMPPAIFNWDIFFDTRDWNTRVALESFSSGEKQKLYSLTAIIYHLQNIDSISPGRLRYDAVNIFLEEIELYFHPEWQRTFCHDLITLVYKAGLRNIGAINVVFVTHSPYLLSDIPKTNVLFLKDGVPDYSMQENTFGSNINGLLKNGFFLPSLPMGEFAHTKINALFGKLHSGDVLPEEMPRIYQDILRVGEPVIRQQLMMLYKILN